MIFLKIKMHHHHSFPFIKRIQFIQLTFHHHHLDQFVYNIVDMFVVIHSIEIVLNQDNSNKVNFPKQIHDQDIELPTMNHIEFQSTLKQNTHSFAHSSDSSH